MYSKLYVVRRQVRWFLLVLSVIKLTLKFPAIIRLTVYTGNEFNMFSNFFKKNIKIT